MKRFKIYPNDTVTASENTRFSDADVVNILNKYGIDTTKCQYRLRVETDQIYNGSDSYVKKFTCSGDYLAFFSMKIHKSPNASNLSAIFDNDISKFEKFVSDNPDIGDIAYEAEASWSDYGDGSERISYLKNLSTGEFLYEDEYR